MTVRKTALGYIRNCDNPVCPSKRPKPENVDVAKNTMSNVPKIPPTPWTENIKAVVYLKFASDVINSKVT